MHNKFEKNILVSGQRPVVIISIEPSYCYIRFSDACQKMSTHDADLINSFNPFRY